MKIKHIALATLLSSTMMISNSANAQLTITGYTEANYVTGSSKGPLSATFAPLAGGWDASSTANTNIAPSAHMGNETQIRFTTTHTIPGGLKAQAMAELRRQSHVWEEREVRLGAADDSWVVFAGSDFQRGIETVRTINPTVNNRVTDIVGSSIGLSDVIDSSSANNYFGFALPKLGPGHLSFAHMPNSLDTRAHGSDEGSSAVGTNAGESRTSIGYAATIGPVTVGVGALKGENRSSATSKNDSEAFTIGARYVTGPFAIGFQFHDQEVATAVAAETTQKQRTLSATYALTKEVSVGYAKTKAEQTVAGVKLAGEIDQDLIQAAYNFGPAVIQADYLSADNAQYLTGTEIKAAKIKLKVNF